MRPSCSSESSGCCFDPAMCEQVFACGATQTESFIQSRSNSSAEGTELQTLGSSGQEEKRKEIGKEIGMMRRRQVGGMKALRWILLWILIGIKMQMVEAVEKEIPARQEMERMLETALVHRVGNMARWRMMGLLKKTTRGRTQAFF